MGINALDRYPRMLLSPPKDLIMTRLLKILPLFTTLAAAPAIAAEPDPHAGHHPAVAADVATAATPPATTAEANPAMKACPMMDGKMGAGSSPMSGKGPDGQMMMADKDMHCMGVPVDANSADAPHDHEHPDAPVPK